MSIRYKLYLTMSEAERGGHWSVENTPVGPRLGGTQRKIKVISSKQIELYGTAQKCHGKSVDPRASDSGERG